MMRLLHIPFMVFVLFAQSIRLAMSQIWSNKMRSVLTTIGIVIGVASVTSVIAALTGLKANVLASFEDLGTDKVYISPDFPGRIRSSSDYRRVVFRPELFDDFLEYCPSLKSFTRQISFSFDVAYGARTEKEVQTTGIEPAWHDIERRDVVLGRRFSLIDGEQSRPVCLINHYLIEKLGMPRDPTGQPIIINGQRFLIVGVLEDHANNMFGGNSSDGEVYMPFSTLYELITGGNTKRIVGMRVTAAAQTPAAAEEAKAEIQSILRRRRHIMPGEPDTFRVDYVSSYVDQFNSMAQAVTMVATGIVGISLLVGGVGIMNIMLVSVSERTREIGLRKAVGAPPAAILLQFLVESVMLCFIGGLVGTIAGAGLTHLLAGIPGAKLERATIPPWAVALSFGFAAGVGLIFGMFPAIKAARLDPIEALRHE